MSVVAVLLALFACLLGFVGFMMLTQVTNGVGAIALGCLVAIFARLAQASAHHADTKAQKP
jgi:amino acid transporter